MKVLLVNMPCSSIRPPLGISLLKSHLARDGVEVSIFNANIRYALRSGPRFYHYISEVAPVESLLGEWLFSECVFPTASSGGYLEAMRAEFPHEFPDEAVRRLEALREQSSDFLDECLDECLREDHDVVGFTTSFAQNMASLALARRIKDRRPATPIAFGGANCEDAMGLALHRAFPFIDMVFCGEADLSFPSAIRALAQGGSPAGIPGVIHRDSGGASRYSTLTPERVRELDALPFPDYDDFFVQYDALPDGSRVSGVPMETSRGCWWGEKHHCTFCGLNGLAMPFRSKTADRALAEVDHLRHRYRVEDIQMVDNILDMRYLRTFLPALAERKVRPALFYETKANLTYEQLQLFRSAGIKAIQPGIESLDSDVLRIMRKGTTGVRNIELLKHCRELGLWPHWNILYGFPGESPDAYERMADMVSSLVHLDPPNVCIRLRLDRFSPLFTEAEESGLVDVRPARAYGLLYDLPPDVLHDLAYYFDFAYRDGRVPDRYAERLATLVRDWQEKRHGDLVMTDHGDAVEIVDTRNGAPRTWHLTGAERRLYLLCGSGQTPRALEQELGAELDAERLRGVLAEWVENGLAIELDGRYLSLAVNTNGRPVRRRRRKPSWHQVLEYSLAPERGGRRSGLFTAPERFAIAQRSSTE